MELRPSVRYAVAVGVGVALVVAGMALWSSSAPSPVPTSQDLPPEPVLADRPAVPGAPPTTDEVLDRLEAREAAELGEREAAVRRRRREQLMEQRGR